MPHPDETCTVETENSTQSCLVVDIKRNYLESNRFLAEETICYYESKICLFVCCDLLWVLCLCALLWVFLC